MRNKFIAGNWKMNGNVQQTRDLITALLNATDTVSKTTMMVAPPFTSLQTASALLSGKKIELGAQNCFWEEQGAYTGEISAGMLKDAGCKYVILGHSERRQYFNETDKDVNRKISAALRNNLLPIVCVGETLEQRESGAALKIVEHQVKESLSGFSPDQANAFTIAYEPVWAIGTGRAATPHDAVEVHTMIRNVLASLFDSNSAQAIRIQYGGSVNAENVESFIREEEIDGALVGGASLKSDAFAKIILTAERYS
ncbi:MAG TPA: triose-phosphate isomerase [Acidobacteriota bacterium]|nr:triose-phosphate isomerase [Acidobacteriota bacterium]